MPDELGDKIPVVFSPQTFSRHSSAVNYIQGRIRTRQPRQGQNRFPGLAPGAWGKLAASATITAASGLTLGSGSVKLCDRDGNIYTADESVDVANAGGVIDGGASGKILPLEWTEGEWTVCGCLVGRDDPCTHVDTCCSDGGLIPNIFTLTDALGSVTMRIAGVHTWRGGRTISVSPSVDGCDPGPPLLYTVGSNTMGVGYVFQCLGGDEFAIERYWLANIVNGPADPITGDDICTFVYDPGQWVDTGFGFTSGIQPVFICFEADGITENFGPGGSVGCNVSTTFSTGNCKTFSWTGPLTGTPCSMTGADTPRCRNPETQTLPDPVGGDVTINIHYVPTHETVCCNPCPIPKIDLVATDLTGSYVLHFIDGASPIWLSDCISYGGTFSRMFLRCVSSSINAGWITYGSGDEAACIAQTSPFFTGYGAMDVAVHFCDPFHVEIDTGDPEGNPLLIDE